VGLYHRFLFPLLLEWGLDAPEVERERAVALSTARGRVLEVGFGFGGSLTAYPAAAGGSLDVTGIDPHAGLLRRAGRRVARAAFPVHRVRGDARRLPFRAGSFDTVVTQFTLCSLPEPVACLAEMGRVLAPRGRLLFLEHGRSDDPRVARRQTRLAPIFQWLGDGCRPDRPIDELVRAAGLTIESLDRFEFGSGPRVTRSLYRGRASIAAGGRG
jgi:ubiquinone/menaquinone biosynthesis C-methylase UbiE